MKPTDTSIKAESSISELVIQPDGRVFVFGLSQPLLEMLGRLQSHDPHLAQRLQASRVGSKAYAGE